MISDVIFEAVESIKEYKKDLPSLYDSGGKMQERVDNLLEHMTDVLCWLDMADGDWNVGVYTKVMKP